jgi:DNA-binding transcriptional regulator LsrR (DeoR family)
MSDQSVKKTLDVARRAAVTLVRIGAVDRESGQYRTGYLNDDDLEYIRGEGAIGEVCGTYFLPNGAICPVEMNERTIAVGPGVMKGIPNRIGVSWGQEKAIANIGAVRSGLVNVLITDEPTARKMLVFLDEEGSAATLEERSV